MEKLQNILEYRRAKQVEISFDKPSNVCLDGEIVKTEKILMRIIPKKLSVLVPKGASFAETESDDAFATV